MRYISGCIRYEVYERKYQISGKLEELLDIRYIRGGIRYQV